ncbi:hypothetical protein U1Q18_048083, partial [Sarracenia purpurea var. burkii]
PGMFPKSLHGYVKRALARCKDDTQMASGQVVMKEIQTQRSGPLNCVLHLSYAHKPGKSEGNDQIRLRKEQQSRMDNQLNIHLKLQLKHPLSKMKQACLQN